jgi:hypothetical protein
LGYNEQLLVLDTFSIKVVATTDRVEIRGAMPTYVTTARTSGRGSDGRMTPRSGDTGYVSARKPRDEGATGA